MTTVQRCLEVSTVHLAPRERERLLPGLPTQVHCFIGPLSVYVHCDDTVARAHVLVCDEEDRTWRREWPSLAAAVDAAWQLGATMLLVDPDADHVTGLARYE